MSFDQDSAPFGDFPSPPTPLPVRPASPPPPAISPLMLQHLRATKPWVRLMSILGFIYSGLMVLLAFVSLIAGILGGREGILLALVGFLYFAVAMLYIYPSICLFRYADSIARVLQGGGPGALESALGHQKSFWKFVGIFMLIGLALAVITIPIVIIFGIAAASFLGG